MTRVELVTSPLPRVCSTTELHGRKILDEKTDLKIKQIGKYQTKISFVEWAGLDSN